MPTHYQTDKDYNNKQEEIADIHDAIRSKKELKKAENVKDFDEFVKEQERDSDVQSQNR